MAGIDRTQDMNYPAQNQNDFFNEDFGSLWDMLAQILLAIGSAVNLLRFRSRIVTNGNSVTIQEGETNIYEYNIINLDAQTIYVKLYNELVVAGLGAVVDTIEVPPNGSVSDSVKWNYSLNCSVRAVTGSADADNTAPLVLPIIEIKYN